MTTLIYTLIDPRSDQVRYVGKSNNPIKRLHHGHLQKVHLQKKTKKNSWLKNLKSENLLPKLEVIDEVSSNTKQEWSFWEKHYIRLYRSFGANLTNGTEGGDGNDNGFTSCNLKKRRSVLQFTKEGVFVNEWNSVGEVATGLSIGQGSVSSVIDSEKCYSIKGNLFLFKDQTKTLEDQTQALLKKLKIVEELKPLKEQKRKEAAKISRTYEDRVRCAKLAAKSRIGTTHTKETKEKMKFAKLKKIP